MNLAIQYWKLNVIINDAFKCSVIMSKFFSIKLKLCNCFRQHIEQSKKSTVVKS